MKVLLALALSVATCAAYALEPGSRLAPWTLSDQFDQPYSLQSGTRIVLVARGMGASGLLGDALEGKPKGYLEARGAVFVADIHRMPSLISKMFAVPAMRDYPYRVLLDRDGSVAARYPGEKETLLWLQLENQMLVSQQVFTDAEALHRALEAAPVVGQ